MDILYIVMPAYNEEQTIKTVVSDWYQVLKDKSPESRLVVADSGSTDHTHEILLEMQQNFPKIEIISDSGKEHGPKLMCLYDYAIKNGADYIFQTDSDGHTVPKEFYDFWKMRHDYNGIFGSRKVRGDGKIRYFVEKVVCLLLKIYFGVKIPDANAPFRLMSTDTVQKYLYRMRMNYNLPNIMLATYFVYYEEKTKFKDITFKQRQGGINSINFSKIIGIGLQSLSDFRILKKAM